jgi:hypothetical protein
MLMAILNIYIPHCMRVNAEQTIVLAGEDGGKGSNVKDPERNYGTRMSVLGPGIATQIGGVVFLAVVIVLSKTLSGDAVQSAYDQLQSCQTRYH